MAIFVRTAVRLLTASLLCWASAAPAAQGPPSLAIEALPLTHMRDGQVQGCGLRFTGGEARSPVSSWFDVSLNVFRRGIAIAQSIAYEIRRSEVGGDSRPTIAPVESTWVRAGERIARRGENMERNGALVYTLVSDDVVEVFEAVAKGEPVTFGIKRWGEPTDIVYMGQAIMDAESRHQIGACLGELLQE
jgi:hypothetical protein